MKTLNTITELKNKINESSFSGGGRQFFSLDPDTQATIRFRQELAADGKNYKADRGTAQLVSVHRSPLNFKKSMVCTAEEGACWACEQVSTHEAGNKWRPQNHIVVNVGVKDDDGTWTNQILDQGFSKSHIGEDLVNYAITTKSIMGHTFVMKRSGKGMKTDYSLIPIEMSDKEPKELASIDLDDLDGKYKTLDYDSQEAFMTALDGDMVADSAAKKW